jgi:hypothetical protein
MDTTKSVTIVDDDHSFRKTIRDILRAKVYAPIAAAKCALFGSGNRIHSRLRSVFAASIHNEQSLTKDSESLALLILILASVVMVMGTGLLLAIPKP